MIYRSGVDNQRFVVAVVVEAMTAFVASAASTSASAVSPWAIVRRSFQFEQVEQFVAALWGQPRPSPWRLLILASLLYFPT